MGRTRIDNPADKKVTRGVSMSDNEITQFLPAWEADPVFGKKGKINLSNLIALSMQALMHDIATTGKSLSELQLQYATTQNNTPAPAPVKAKKAPAKKASTSKAPAKKASTPAPAKSE